MMSTVRALGSFVYIRAVGVAVALLSLTVTRAAGLAGVESSAPLVGQGERLFALDFTPERGLGPLFNGTSCLTCHNTPSAGGMGGNGLATVLRVGRLQHTGFDPLMGQGGPIVRAHSVAELGQPCGLALGIGLGTRPRLLHDGRARTMVAAIMAHGGEAASAVGHFRELSSSERDMLLACLQSL